MTENTTIDQERDLILTRVVDVPREKLWRCWTEPALLTAWFAPKPWTATDCEIDLQPGGIFRTVMQGPDGEGGDHTGCILEAVAPERIVFTDALQPGFRPSAESFFSAIVTFEEVPGGTRYTAVARHKNAEDCQKHRDMGFHEGWGLCLDQLVAVAKSLD
ncbi:SRPBCC family protein [Pacificispira sp.]|uniref:SRPBCC family protein n=1 Tax=Pacificispira sp. TaxID=2888761 RepID=UPI003B51D451